MNLVVVVEFVRLRTCWTPCCGLPSSSAWWGSPAPASWFGSEIAFAS